MTVHRLLYNLVHKYISHIQNNIKKYLISNKIMIVDCN